LPLDPAASLFCPSTARLLRKSAGDSRRLTRREQEKNVEERVPAFTQHTQFFHRRKIRECKYFPSRKCNESWKKNKIRLRLAKHSRSARRGFAEYMLWKNSVPARKMLHNEFPVHQENAYFVSRRSNSYTPLGSPPMIRRSFSTTMAFASSRAFCGV
jgi:hypothetical protein